MRDVFLRVLIGCALLPPGKIYIFPYGEKAQSFSENLQKLCPDKFALVEEGEPPIKEGSDVNEIFTKGNEEFDKLEFEEAVKLYESGLERLEGDMSLIENWRLLISALVKAGLSYVALGRYEEAKRVYMFLLRIRPDYKPSSVAFPPQAQKLFEEAKKEIAYCPLKVESFPSEATLYIDGLKAGLTPVFKKDVPCGKHLLVVEKTGYQKWQKVVEVKEGEEYQSAFLRAIGVKPPLKNWWTLNPSEVKSLCKDGGFFNFLFVREEGERVSLIYCSGKETFSEVLPQDGYTSLPELISKRGKKEESEDEGSLIKSWWFWTTIAVLAGGVGTGIYFGSREGDGGRKVIIRW